MDASWCLLQPHSDGPPLRPPLRPREAKTLLQNRGLCKGLDAVAPVDSPDSGCVLGHASVLLTLSLTPSAGGTSTYFLVLARASKLSL